MAVVAKLYYDTSREFIWEQLFGALGKHSSAPLFLVLPELGSANSTGSFGILESLDRVQK